MSTLLPQRPSMAATKERSFNGYYRDAHALERVGLRHLASRCQGPRGAHRRDVGQAQVRHEAGQTGQQLLLGAYQALERQVAAGTVTMHTRHEMLELLVVDGRARGIITRDMITGELQTHIGDAVVLASGGYGNVFYLSTNAKGS